MPNAFGSAKPSNCNASAFSPSEPPVRIADPPSPTPSPTSRKSWPNLAGAFTCSWRIGPSLAMTTKVIKGLHTHASREIERHKQKRDDRSHPAFRNKLSFFLPTETLPEASKSRLPQELQELLPQRPERSPASQLHLPKPQVA